MSHGDVWCNVTSFQWCQYDFQDDLCRIAFEVSLVLRDVTCPNVAIINEVLIYVDDFASMRNLWTSTSVRSALALWVPAHNRCVSSWTYQIVELVIGAILLLCCVSYTSVRDWEVDVSIQCWFSHISLSSVGHCRPFARTLSCCK